MLASLCSIHSVLIDIYLVFGTLAWGAFHAIQVKPPAQSGHQETDPPREGRIRPRHPAKLSAQARSKGRSQEGRPRTVRFELVSRYRASVADRGGVQSSQGHTLPPVRASIPQVHNAVPPPSLDGH